MAPKSTSNAGIRQLSNGESVIPSSTRADGTVRKEIRVKPGYKPAEDVEVYKNRTAEAWKHRGKGGVPGAEALNTEEKEAQASAATNKNAKRREARRKAAAAVRDDDDGKQTKDTQSQPNGVASQSNGSAFNSTEIVDEDVENAKEARKLAKKLRQARDLQEKKEKGDELLPEQFAKVIKINELIRQLDSLGFDVDGQRKDQRQDDDEAVD